MNKYIFKILKYIHTYYLMSDTDKLIKNIAIDIMCVTTIWGLLNNPYTALSNKFHTPVPMCITIFGTGISLFVMKKYF